MGNLGAVLVSVIWSLLNLWKVLGTWGTSPELDIIVKAIIIAVVIIAVREYSPI